MTLHGPNEIDTGEVCYSSLHDAPVPRPRLALAQRIQQRRSRMLYPLPLPRTRRTWPPSTLSAIRIVVSVLSRLLLRRAPSGGSVSSPCCSCAVDGAMRGVAEHHIGMTDVLGVEIEEHVDQLDAAGPVARE